MFDERIGGDGGGSEISKYYVLCCIAMIQGRFRREGLSVFAYW